MDQYEHLYHFFLDLLKTNDMVVLVFHQQVIINLHENILVLFKMRKRRKRRKKRKKKKKEIESMNKVHIMSDC